MHKGLDSFLVSRRRGNHGLCLRLEVHVAGMLLTLRNSFDPLPVLKAQLSIPTRSYSVGDSIILEVLQWSM